MKSLTRSTKETEVTIAVAETIAVDTGIPFFDHMLATLIRYAGLSLAIRARGDLPHHLMEDVALTLGAFVRKATPAAAARYGERTIPMDDALVSVVLDLGGRAYFVGALPSRRYTHFFRSFATAAECAMHLRVLAGTDRHHVREAAMKALGLALRQAMRPDGDEIFSTKGTIRWEETP